VRSDAEQNPYASPEARLDELSAEEEALARRDPDALAQALAELNRHLSDPEKLAADARLEDAVVPRHYWLALAITLGSGMAAFVAGSLDQEVEWLAPLGFIAVASGLLALVFILITSWRVGRRRRALTPEKACKQQLKAMFLGRTGTWAVGICPSARSALVRPPQIPPLPMGSELYRIDQRRDASRFLKVFCRTGDGHVRWSRLRKVFPANVLSGQPEVAICKAKVHLRTWPQWANVVSLVLVVSASFIGIPVAALLYFGLRRQKTVMLEKTFLRGKNGLWYAFRVEPFERIIHE
jgi:hypothetical protein